MAKRVRLTERDLRLLGIFRVLAEAGGLTAAEATLGMERSTISRHLQALEGRMGGRLCSRGPTGFKLTELGQKVFRAALTARDAITHAEDELADSLGGLMGELDLGIADYTITNPQCRIAEIIGRFRDAAPAVETHLSIRPPLELVDEILKRRVELGITAFASVRSNLAAISLFDEEFRLYARTPPTGNGVSLGDLTRHRFALAMREGHWQSEAVAANLRLAQCGVGHGLEAAAILVASGGYIGFLPTHMVEALQPRYPLVEIQGAEYLRHVHTFSLVYDPARAFSAAASAFIRFARLVHGEYRGDPSSGSFAIVRARTRKSSTTFGAPSR
jgi:DNA-binding transcriptional LysR family regulator